MTSCFTQSEKTGFGDGTRVRREKRNFKYFNSLHFLAGKRSISSNPT